MEPRFLEFEQDPPNWRDQASPEALSSLSKKETKRQEVMNGEQKRDEVACDENETWADKIRLLLQVFLFESISYFVSIFFPLSELFATEHAHVRMLSVLQMIFSKPLEREELLTTTELAAIFPNLDEIIEMHC